MNRLLALLTVGLIAGTAGADIPPPEGYKRVDGVHTITTDKDLPGYTFYTLEVPSKRVAAVKFDAKTPVVIKDPGTRDCYQLVAVPNDVVKKYADVKKLHAALIDDTAAGALRADQFFHCRVTVKNAHKGKSAAAHYKVEALDAKGFTLKVVKTETVDESKLGPEELSEGPEGGPIDFALEVATPDAARRTEPRGSVAPAPRGGYWVAGLAAFAALVLGGLWLTGRARRKA
jgi:hypothetical protein